MQWSCVRTKRVSRIPTTFIALIPILMASRKSNCKAILREPVWEFHWRMPVHVLILLICCPGVTGCQRLPGGQAMRQYQLESDRLLAEFRAQKKRAEELEARNGQLEQRLAESEKQLARGLSGTSSRSTASNTNRGRTDSELMIGDARGGGSTLNNLSDAKSSRSTGRVPTLIQKGGLPDAFPSTSGKLTSGNRIDPFSLGGSRDLRGDPKSESQWRPVNRGQ